MVLPEQRVYSALANEVNRDIVSSTTEPRFEGELYNLMKGKHNIKSLTYYIPVLVDLGLVKQERFGYSNTDSGNFFNEMTGMIEELVGKQRNLADLAGFGRILPSSDGNTLETSVNPLSVHLEFLGKPDYFDFITSSDSFGKISNRVPNKKMFYRNCKDLGYLLIHGDFPLKIEKSDFAIGLGTILWRFLDERQEYNRNHSGLSPV